MANSGSFRAGHARLGGRKKGVPNKSSASVREAILATYAAIGGDSRFAEWARINPEEFYKLFARVLPVEAGAPGTAENPARLVISWQQSNGS